MENANRALHPAKALLAAIVAAYVAYAARFWFIADDAYITFRFSRNLARGIGLRYNPGDHVPVEGYSNFLWMLAAVPIEVLNLDVALAMGIFSMLCGVGLIVSVFQTLRTHLEVAAGPALLATLALATAPATTIWASSGLETMAFALFTFVTFERLVLARQERAWLGGAAAGLGLSLIRTEGFAWFVVIAVLALAGRILDGRQTGRGWRELARPVLKAAAIVTPIFAVYFGLRTAYFGSLLSNTTKVKVGFDLYSLQVGLQYLTLYSLTTLVPFVALAGVWPALKRSLGRGIPLAAMAVAFPAYALVVGGDYMPMGRLLVPGSAFAFLLLGIGIDQVWKSRGKAVAVSLGLAAVFLGIAPAHDLHLVPQSVREAFHFRVNTDKFRSEFSQWEFIKRSTPRWRALGQAMADAASPGDTWVAGAIGARGYFSGLYIYDAGGLVSREVAERPFERSGNGRSPGHEKRVPFDFFLEQNPTYLRARIVSGDGRAVAARIRSWNTSRSVREKYIPEVYPRGENLYLVTLRRAPPDTDTAGIWGDLGALVSSNHRGPQK